MQSSELWAAWIVAGVMVGLVAWMGHIEPHGSGLTPASDVVRRAPPTDIRPAGETDEPAQLVPVLQQLEPSSGGAMRVYLCVIDGPGQGVC